VVLVHVLSSCVLLQAYDDRTSTSDWVARDDTTLKYGPIDAATEFYDPEGGALFDDDVQRDEENCEGFTGNAGDRGSTQGPCGAHMHVGAPVVVEGLHPNIKGVYLAC
jgi:hypothetical protein